MNMTENEWNDFLRQLQSEMPNARETFVIGRLHSMGYHINRERNREAIRCTDPLNTPLRWRGSAASRCPYSAPAPNSLWHVGMLHLCVLYYME